MAQPAKFLFERSFEQSQEAPSVEQRLREDFEQELAMARQAAFEDGRAEGMRAAMDELEAKITDTLGQILERTGAISAEMSQARHAMCENAMEIAVAAAEALACELVRREPLANLEALFMECLEYANKPPHIAIRVNDVLVDDLQTRTTELAAQSGYAGDLVVVGDPEIPVGDTKLEWADGGLTREFGTTRSRIVTSVRNYVGAQKAMLTAPSVPGGNDPMKLDGADGKTRSETGDDA